MFNMTSADDERDSQFTPMPQYATQYASGASAPAGRSSVSSLTGVRNATQKADAARRDALGEGQASGFLHAQAHLYSFVHGNLFEIEQYVHELESRNKQMKEKLIEQLKPTLFSFFMGKDRALQSAMFSSWKRHTDIEHIAHMKENHERDLRNVHEDMEAVIEQAQKRLRDAKQQNGDFEEQLKEASSYADELDIEKANGAGRLNVLRAQLAEADRTIKLLNRNALGSLDGARHEIVRVDRNLKKFKNDESMGENFEQLHPSERPAPKAKSQHRGELQTIKAQLEQLARHVHAEQSKQGMSTAIKEQAWDWPDDSHEGGGEGVFDGEEEASASKATLSPGVMYRPVVVPLRKQPSTALTGMDPLLYNTSSTRMVPPGGSFGVPQRNSLKEASLSPAPSMRGTGGWPAPASVPPLPLNSP